MIKYIKKHRKDIMSRKRTVCSADFKAKVVLELLEGGGYNATKSQDRFFII
jgi:hypothetical protein